MKDFTTLAFVWLSAITIGVETWIGLVDESESSYDADLASGRLKKSKRSV